MWPINWTVLYFSWNFTKSWIRRLYICSYKASTQQSDHLLKMSTYGFTRMLKYFLNHPVTCSMTKYAGNDAVAISTDKLILEKLGTKLLENLAKMHGFKNRYGETTEKCFNYQFYGRTKVQLMVESVMS